MIPIFSYERVFGLVRPGITIYTVIFSKRLSIIKDQKR